MTKRCTKCKKRKKIRQFNADSSRKDGLQCWCIKCLRSYYEENKNRQIASQKLRYDKNPLRYKGEALMRNYGITLKRYNELLKSQKCRCRICGIHQKYLKKRLFVDHDHKTKVIRGLLCVRCNSSLGGFKESPKILENALNYLRGNL